MSLHKWFKVSMALLIMFTLNALTSIAYAQSCDRECLEAIVDDYLYALSQNDPSLLNVTDDVIFTENGVKLELGQALWRTMDGIGSYKHYFADPEMGQVGFYGTVRENGKPTLLELRLALDVNGAIYEIETLVIRNERSALTMENGNFPLPVWTEAIPVEERLSREQLVRTADSYFTGLEQQNGRGVYSFTEDCDRLENSGYTTNSGGTSFDETLYLEEGETMDDLNIFALGCEEQFQTGFFAMVTELHQRRFPLVDIERGVVFAFVFFDHNGKAKQSVLKDGSGGVSRNQIWTWQMGESFKIEKGLIRHIEAWMIASQYHVDGGWDNYNRDYYNIVNMGGIGK